MEEKLDSLGSVGLERVMSGFFPTSRKDDLIKESNEKHKKYQKRVKRDAELWSCKGLAYNKDGVIPQGKEAILHALKELVVGGARGFGLGMALKGALSLLFSALGGKFNKKALFAAFGSDTKRFATFFGVLIGSFRGLNAIIASIRKKDSPENAFIAGSLASFSILLDEQSRRQTISLYLFARSLDVLTKRLCREGIIPYWDKFESLLFGISNMPIMYGFLYEPDILEKGYYKWILRMGNLTDEGLASALRKRRNLYFEQGIKIPFQPCSCGYHEGPCTVYCFTDWIGALGRSAKVYLPVHFIPMIVFRSASLLKDPKSELAKTFVGFFKSCLFLSSYVLCIKSTQCASRNFFQRDSGKMAAFSGFCTSLACTFEKTSRVSELMLYCLPKGLEGTWRYLVKYGYLKNIKYGETLLFTIGMSILLSGSRADFKPTYHRSLCFLVGATPGASSALTTK